MADNIPVEGNLDLKGNQVKNAGFEVVTSLPTTNNFVGRRVTFNNKDYIWNGTEWESNRNWLSVYIDNTTPYMYAKLFTVNNPFQNIELNLRPHTYANGNPSSVNYLISFAHNRVVINKLISNSVPNSGNYHYNLHIKKLTASRFEIYVGMPRSSLYTNRLYADITNVRNSIVSSVELFQTLDTSDTNIWTSLLYDDLYSTEFHSLKTNRLKVNGASISNESINFNINNIEPTQSGTVTKTSTWTWQYLTQSVNFLWLKLKDLFPTTQATTHNYLPKIDNADKKLVKSNIQDDGNRVQIDSPLRVNSKTFYNVAQRISTVGNETGSIYIEMPFGWTNNMGTYEIDIYNYTNNTKAKIIVSGFNSNSPVGWYNYSVQILGNLPSNIVKLGYNSVTDKCCILVGVTTTQWRHPQIYVSKVTQGYSNTSDWSTGWSISIITDETGIANIVTPQVNAGFDVDLLDGKHASDFADVNHTHEYSLLDNLPAIYNADHAEVQFDDFDVLYDEPNDVWLCNDSMRNGPLDDNGGTDTSYNNFEHCVVQQFGDRHAGTKVQVLYITTGNVANLSNGFGSIFYRIQGDKWKRIVTYSDIADLQTQIDSLDSTVNNLTTTVDNKQDKMSIITDINIPSDGIATINPIGNKVYNVNLSGTTSWHTINLGYLNSLDEVSIIINNPNNAGWIAINQDALYKFVGVFPDFSINSWIITIWKGLIFTNIIGG